MRQSTITAQGQNEAAVRELGLSDNLRKLLCAKCTEHDIWLPGLSPIVAKSFMEMVALAKTRQATDEEKATIIFNTLVKALQEENQYLRIQTAENARSQGQFKVKNIDWYAEQKTSVPAGYWLVADDIVAATAQLAKIEEVHVHMPVMQIDQRVQASVAAALSGTAKIAFVPVECNGHWTLETFTKTADNKIKQEHFNPIGDGKCGDRVVSKMYQSAQELLGSEKVSMKVVDPTVRANGSKIRAQTMQLVAPSKVETADLRKTQSEESVLPKVGPARLKKAQPVSVLPRPKKTVEQNPHTVFAEKDRSEFRKLMVAWNKRAELALNEIQNLTDAEKAARWRKFVGEAEVALTRDEAPLQLAALLTH